MNYQTAKLEVKKFKRIYLTCDQAFSKYVEENKCAPTNMHEFMNWLYKKTQIRCYKLDSEVQTELPLLNSKPPQNFPSQPF